MTALAREIVAPTSEEAKGRALFQSAFMPPLFKSIFGAYKGKKVPDMQFFQNALSPGFRGFERSGGSMRYSLL